MCFKKRFKPDLIDLEKYTLDLSQWKKNGTTLMPPPMIPCGQFSSREYDAMEKNREAADTIYQAIEGK